MLIFVVFLFAALWFTNQFDQKDKELTWKEFEKLIVSDNVEAVTVSQNKNVPTGRVEIQVDTKNDEDSVRYLYVSDVNEIQNYLKEKKIDYEMPDVPQAVSYTHLDVYKRQTMEYREKFEGWLSNPYFDENTKDELRSIAEDDLSLIHILWN